MDEEYRVFFQELGKNVEAAGRQLQRRPALTLDDLDVIAEVLDISAETIRTVRRTLLEEQS
jgi:hypothetical protein